MYNFYQIVALSICFKFAIDFFVVIFFKKYILCCEKHKFEIDLKKIYNNKNPVQTF